MEEQKVNYRKGSILKLHVINFVTYDEVICDPGPYLNVIIGPNGSGKSTILAALILGLAGTPKTIGRGTRISEYVRNNCTEATISIELYGDHMSDTYVITRKFNVSNQTKWFINDEVVTEADVKKLITKLNIQVNNLCQFLPQDRVQDFAKLNKKELLVNTQIAVGRQDLIEKQESLILLQQDILKITKEMERVSRQLEEAQTETSRLEGRIKNFKDRKTYLEDVDHIKRKLSWKNYSKLTKKVSETRNDLLKAGELVDSYKRKLLPLEKNINDLNKQSMDITKNSLELNKTIKDNERRIVDYIDQIEDVQRIQRELYCEMNVKIKSIEQSTIETQRMEQKIDKLRNDELDYIRQYGDDDSVNQKIKTISNELHKYSEIINDTDSKRIDTLKEVRRLHESINHFNSRVQELENLKDKRLEKLREIDNDAYKGVLWLRNNKHLFKQHVYEPMIMELDILNQDHSKYLESIIGLRDKVAFICESHEDMNLLVRKLREENGLSINVLHSGVEHPSLSTYKSPIPIEHIKQYGFYAYTINLMKGPEAIMKYLCRMYKLHCIPIGDDTTFDLSDKVPSDFKVFFSSQHRFSRIISRYTGAISVKISEVGSDGTFSIFLNQNEINQLQKCLNDYKKEEYRYNQKITELDNKKETVKNERLKLLEQHRSLLKVRDDLKEIRLRLTSTQVTLKNYIENSPKEDDIKNVYNKKIKELLLRLTKICGYLKNGAVQLSDNLKKKIFLNISMNVIKDKISTLENEGQNLREEYDETKKAYQNIESVLKRMKDEEKAALKTAKNLSGGFTPEDDGFNKFREKYLALPKSEEELNQLMEELEIKIRLMSTADESEVREYENGLKLIEEYTTELHEKKPKIHEYEEKRKRIYQEWIVPLEELVGEINKNFSSYYESMGCAGEVEINKEKGEENIADYGLAIRVTYRAEDPLQELNQYVQSGGERAVATAVFMLSMQGLTTVPFRCVDEINQGMDPQNERRIFEILVKATCRADTGQYFLITPKLIPDLKFGDDMKVHIVHNSQFIKTKVYIDLNEILDN